MLDSRFDQQFFEIFACGGNDHRAAIINSALQHRELGTPKIFKAIRAALFRVQVSKCLSSARRLIKC